MHMAPERRSAPLVASASPNPDDTAGTDAQLLQGFLSGTDESAECAFAALVERHSPVVHRVCFDILGNRHEAQDAAQAVFLVLARKGRSIRKPESLGPWLHGVALRVAPPEMRRGEAKGCREPQSRNRLPARPPRIRDRNHGLRQPAPRNRSTPREISTPHHSLLHAGANPAPSRAQARLAPGHGPDSPAPGPRTIACQALVRRHGVERDYQLRPHQVALDVSAGRRARSRLDHDHSSCRGPLCRRQVDSRARRCAGERTGFLNARHHDRCFQQSPRIDDRSLARCSHAVGHQTRPRPTSSPQLAR